MFGRSFVRVFPFRSTFVRTCKSNPKTGLPFELNSDHKIKMNFTGDYETETDIDENEIYLGSDDDHTVDNSFNLDF